MSQVCPVTGKRPATGNNVSHANNKTNRRFLPNLTQTTLVSDTLDRSFRLKVSASALRTLDRRGGLDAFLLNARDENLSERALKIKRDIQKARATA